MTVNGANFLQYVPKENGNSNNNGAGYLQFMQQTWAAGGLFVDANSTEEQKVQAGTTSLMEILRLFGANEAGAASQEVQANKEAANNLEQSVKTTTENTNSKVQELVSKMKETGEKIQEALDKIDDENKEKEKHQEALQEYLSTIDICKGILENPNSTSAERTVALEKLKAAGRGIAELVSLVEKIQTNTDDSQSEVEDLNEEQSDLSGEVDTTLQNGNIALEKAATEAQAQIAVNTATATKGTGNEITSGAAKAAAETLRTSSSATSFIPLVGGALSSGQETLAVKCDQVASDQGQAAKHRIPGTAQTQAQISATEATRQASLTQFADFNNYALGVADDNVNISSTFYSFLEPIGAWLEDAENIETESQELDDAIQVVSQQVEEEKDDEESGKTGNEDESGIILDYDSDNLDDLTK